MDINQLIQEFGASGVIAAVIWLLGQRLLSLGKKFVEQSGELLIEVKKDREAFQSAGRDMATAAREISKIREAMERQVKK